MDIPKKDTSIGALSSAFGLLANGYQTASDYSKNPLQAGAINVPTSQYGLAELSAMPWIESKDAYDFGKKNVFEDAFSGATNGAMAGYQTTGTPIGALVGGGIGALYNLGAGIERNQQAQRQADLYEKQRQKQMKNRMYALDLGAQQIAHDRTLGFNRGFVFSAGGALDGTNGVTMFPTGGSHEQNPNGGIYQGMSADGQPNLVEEGEVKWNDYVFPVRMKPTKSLLRQFNLDTKLVGKNYAEIATEIQKESETRPNDSVYIQTMDEMLGRLRACHEEHTARNQAREMAKMLESMPPEAQMQMMQQMAAPQQMPQQEQMGQPMQMPMEQMEQGMQEQPMAAYGGWQKAHLFAKGGNTTPFSNLRMMKITLKDKDEVTPALAINDLKEIARQIDFDENKIDELYSEIKDYYIEFGFEVPEKENIKEYINIYKENNPGRDIYIPTFIEDYQKHIGKPISENIIESMKYFSDLPKDKRSKILALQERNKAEETEREEKNKYYQSDEYKEYIKEQQRIDNIKEKYYELYGEDNINNHINKINNKWGNANIGRHALSSEQKKIEDKSYNDTISNIPKYIYDYIKEIGLEYFKYKNNAKDWFSDLEKRFGEYATKESISSDEIPADELFEEDTTVNEAQSVSENTSKNITAPETKQTTVETSSANEQLVAASSETYTPDVSEPVQQFGSQAELDKYYQDAITNKFKKLKGNGYKSEKLPRYYLTPTQSQAWTKELLASDNLKDQELGRMLQQQWNYENGKMKESDPYNKWATSNFQGDELKLKTDGYQGIKHTPIWYLQDDGTVKTSLPTEPSIPSELMKYYVVDWNGENQSAQYPIQGVTGTESDGFVIPGVYNANPRSYRIDGNNIYFDRIQDYDVPVQQTSPEVADTMTPYPEYSILPGLGTAAASLMGAFNRPDYEKANDLGAFQWQPRDYTPIGDYQVYSPLDENYMANTLRSQAGATRSAIGNHTSPSTNASLLAADYNAMSALGDSIIKMKEYNDKQKQAVSTFNRGTNQYNAGEANTAEQANFGLQPYMYAQAKDVAEARDAATTLASEANSKAVSGALNTLGKVYGQSYNNDVIRWMIENNLYPGVKTR